MSHRFITLISVSDKTGIAEFDQALVGFGAAIISTGGTAFTISRYYGPRRVRGHGLSGNHGRAYQNAPSRNSWGVTGSP